MRPQRIRHRKRTWAISSIDVVTSLTLNCSNLLNKWNKYRKSCDSQFKIRILYATKTNTIHFIWSSKYYASISIGKNNTAVIQSLRSPDDQQTDSPTSKRKHRRPDVTIRSHNYLSQIDVHRKTYRPILLNCIFIKVIFVDQKLKKTWHCKRPPKPIDENDALLNRCSHEISAKNSGVDGALLWYGFIVYVKMFLYQHWRVRGSNWWMSEIQQEIWNRWRRSN